MQKNSFWKSKFLHCGAKGIIIKDINPNVKYNNLHLAQIAMFAKFKIITYFEFV